jgi:hypothetical protein
MSGCAGHPTICILGQLGQRSTPLSAGPQSPFIIPGGLLLSNFRRLSLPKLLDQVRDLIRLRHYSYRTEQTYL